MNFWVDFSGALLVRDVANREEAEEKFWATLSEHNKTHEDEFQFCEVDLITECK